MLAFSPAWGSGERWPAAIVTHGPTPAGGYQFTARDRMVLTASPGASLREVIGGVLPHWPRRA
ncbi:hypothetical protein [Archangium sp.]|uniref:hypothetical protein n=1 Tax=Archangium sp. TaxID=1872627 RepID=UPI002ED89890